ncbi:MAG: hypothetical protein JKY49_07420 [Cohaesibacteraceae bacterium]|nr:hypothetical protein [Cohaesibacteraceae bacterium]
MSIEIETKIFSVEVDLDPQSGKIKEERWLDNNNKFNRLGDLPAVIQYCADTGQPKYRRWHNGQGCHRSNDRPSTIVTDTSSGMDIGLSFEILGQSHREGDKPAFILKTPEGQLEEEGYWKDGNLHRDPELGPARLFYSERTGKVTGFEYWVDGVQVPTPKEKPSLDI